jgi:hypothetical protein
MAKCPGAVIGFICYLRDGQSYTLWQKRLLEVGKVLREAMGGPVTFEQIMSVVGPSPVSDGIGLFYRGEYNDYKDKNFNPIERAKKRAEVNARHHRFATHAPVYDGDNGGIVLDAPYHDALEGGTTPQPENTTTPAHPKPKKSSEQIIGELYGERTPEPMPVADPAIMAEIIESDTSLQDLMNGVEPDPQPMTLQEAKDRLTPKNVRYADLSDDQLTVIAEACGKHPERNGNSDSLLAAQLILAGRKIALQPNLV